MYSEEGFGRHVMISFYVFVYTASSTSVRLPSQPSRLVADLKRAARSQAPWPRQDLAQGVVPVRAAPHTKSWRLQYRLAVPALCLGAVHLLLGWLVPH